MGHTASRQNDRGTRWISLGNALVNLFWTVLCVAPVFLFCWRHVSQTWLYGVLAMSALPYLVPRNTLRLVQISKDATIYRRMRVPLANDVSQDGKLLRRLVGSGRPTCTRRPDELALQQLERKTYTRERFHLAGAIFFLAVTGIAIQQKLFLWGAYLLAANVIYNIYPVLLQQYLRMRMLRIRTRQSGRR